MFFIVNKTKRTVIISDLGVTLGPRQAIDLDKIVKRSKSDSSQMLKLAKKKGDIEIRRKDGEKTETVVYKEKDNSLNDFKNEIIGEMKGSMRDMLAQQSITVQGGISEEQLEKMMQKLIKSMPKSTKETVVIQQGGEKTERTDEEIEIDEEKLAEINARTVDEMTKDTEVKSVHYKEEQQENTILNNINELEELLFDD